ncbi:MAG: zinc dependent phospholipase C family protein [Coriobacteriia bacterium]|nr:zinc dependent phospholipase C family protein [Coriobacteriia bacterium]
MPAIITHDFFAHQAYEDHSSHVGYSFDEHDAFILGSQGPDPLFYLIVNPLLKDRAKIGGALHAEKPAEVLHVMRQAAEQLDETQRPVGRAYALGFLCHYLLDRTVHPLVYAQEYALCDAGEPGLDRNNGSDVHAVIETELDEMTLFTHTGKTVAQFAPQDEILKCSDAALHAISRMYVQVADQVLGQAVPEDLFLQAVFAFRAVQAFFHSPRGIKRNTLRLLEGRVGKAAFARAMMHRPVEMEDTPFANSAREPWTNPFTDQQSTASFDDLVEAARADVALWLPRYADPAFSLEQAEALARGLNFSGEPVFAQLLSAEDLD